MGTAGGLLSGIGGLSGLMKGISLFSSLSSVMGGMQQQGAYNQQANMAIAQGNMQAAENERVAFRQAQNEKEQSESARRAQKVAYLASGVTLEGSPLLVMEETRQKGIENVDEILRGGQASSYAAKEEGRMRASSLKSSGRQAFSAGITSGLSTGVRAFT